MRRRACARSRSRWGGAAHLDLLYAAVKLSGARRVIETGVAYGWSTLAILNAFGQAPGARLVSVDMPYPCRRGEAFVGSAVPERLHRNWKLIRLPDRPGLPRAIRSFVGRIDLCHYDSDKSWWGRQYAYPLLWQALTDGGVFISDDIQDNSAFAEFAERTGAPVAVTAFDGKFAGILRKSPAPAI